MRRPLRPLAAFAMVALISAGCSSAPAATGSSGGNDTAATHAPAETSTASSGGNTAAATPTSPTVAPTADPGSGSSGGNNTTNRAQAVQFAECMRKNGVSAFPDPDASGNLTIDQIANGSSLDTNSAAFKQAISACKDLEPPGFTGYKRSPEQQQAALKFAQCIRDNGVKDFPDPAPDAPMIDTRRIPSANRSGGMSILRAAMQKCRGLAAPAGVTGGK